MRNPLRVLVTEYGWVHLSLGLLGNTAFFIDSLFFFSRR